MPTHRTPTRCALGLTGLGLLTIVSSGAGQANPSFAGTWKYNAERTQQEAARKISDAPAFSKDDRARTRSSAAGATSGVPGARAELGPLTLYSRPLPELVIVQTDSTITISDPSGAPRTYRTDGRKEREPLLGVDSLDITAKWKSGKLTIERKLGKFGTVREEYSIDVATKELILDVRLSGPQVVPPMELRRFYGVAPGS